MWRFHDKLAPRTPPIRISPQSRVSRQRHYAARITNHPQDPVMDAGNQSRKSSNKSGQKTSNLKATISRKSRAQTTTGLSSNTTEVAVSETLDNISSPHKKPKPNDANRMNKADTT